MLSKSYRMKKNSQFDYIFKNGKSIKLNKLLIFYSKSKSSKPKVGIVVSKKIGNSVTRNHTKRLLREAIRNNLTHFNNSFNYIIVARQGIENCSYNQISENLLNLIKKTSFYV